MIEYMKQDSICFLCKYSVINIDSINNENDYKTSLFWNQNNKYKNLDKTISLFNCIQCKVVFCKACLNFGYHYALNFTKFKKVIYDSTLFKACGGCFLDKWKEEAIARTQKLVY
jgi:hypothetical protein